MRVLILWADDHSSNLGVRALAQGTAALVQRAHPGSEVVHLHYGSGTSPTPVGDWRRLVRSRLDVREPLVDWLGSFDLAVDTRAGDSFTDIYGQRRLGNQSLLGELVVQSGTRLVLGPQTIGPFTTRRGRAWGRWSMRRATTVMARDSVSAAYADGLGRVVDVVTTDVAFALPRPQAVKRRDVVLNVSGLLWGPNPHVDHMTYRRTVLDLAEGLIASGRRLTLLAHVLDTPLADNDVPAVHEMARALEDDARIDVVIPSSLEDVREVAASAALLVGSRMHACLNALSTGTPAVPLAYSRKFEPLMRDLGWRHTLDLRHAKEPVKDVLRLAEADLAQDVADVVGRADALLEPAVQILRSAS